MNTHLLPDASNLCPSFPPVQKNWYPGRDNLRRDDHHCAFSWKVTEGALTQWKGSAVWEAKAGLDCGLVVGRGVHLVAVATTWLCPTFACGPADNCPRPPGLGGSAA